MLCLDIPVPRCAQRLLRKPSIYCSKEEDSRVIKDFGREFKRSEDETTQACNLASGLSSGATISEAIVLRELRPVCSQLRDAEDGRPAYQVQFKGITKHIYGDRP